MSFELKGKINELLLQTSVQKCCLPQEMIKPIWKFNISSVDNAGASNTAKKLNYETIWGLVK